MSEFIIKSDLYVYDSPDQTIFFDTEKPDEIEIIKHNNLKHKNSKDNKDNK